MDIIIEFIETEMNRISQREDGNLDVAVRFIADLTCLLSRVCPEMTYTAEELYDLMAFLEGFMDN